MLQIKEIVNSIFTSKTYILFCEEERMAWLVDIGDIKPVIEFCEEKQLYVEGVFLTHIHFDHIYGLQSLVAHYPNCKVYTTQYGKIALASEKMNMSRYHGTPFSYDGGNIIVVREGDEMQLFNYEPKIQIYETPGHNPSCLTMVMGEWIFTGDAYIPGVGANTQLPHSNKDQAKQSLERILKLSEGKFIFSGHK